MGVSRWALVGVVLGACASPEPEPSVRPPGDTLVSIVDEAAGEHCPNGGSAVQSGVDDNRDGVLDAAEVDKVDYVCNAEGTPTLVRQTPIAAGDICPGGGLAVQSGRDLDHDGVLDDDEVEQTVTTCDTIEVWNGPLYTSSFSTPAQLEVLAKVRVVNGTLTVDSSPEMPNLELVTGNLESSGTTVELPALRSVVGDVHQDSYGTFELSMPVLERIGGQLNLEATAQHATISAPALTSVGGGLTFIFLTGGDTIDLSALKSIGGDLYLDSNLPNLSLTKLETIEGSLELKMDTTSAVFPALKTVGGNFEVWTEHVTDITLPAAERIVGDAYISSAVPLTKLRLPSLTSVGSLSINSKTLAELDLTALSSVTHTLSISSTLVTSLRLPNLAYVGKWNGTNNESLSIWGNQALATIELPSLVETAGWVAVGGSDALGKLELPALTTSDQVSVDDCSAITEVRVPKLTTTSVVRLSDVPLLTVAEFPKLTRVNSVLRIEKTALTSLSGFAALTYSNYVDLNHDVELVDLHGLENVTLLGYVKIYTNANLVSLAGLGRLARVSGSFDLTNNLKLSNISALASLRYVGMDLTIDGSALVSLAGLDQLATVQGDLRILWNHALATLSNLAALEFVGDELELSHNDVLPAAEVTALRTRLGK